ncbi:N-carbamoyl-D-amino acid hydrolase [Roseimaritima multifibrata]|uniref:N-carbamoyl-D-amino acid hydrolase n=1 Tax=Roseimaritima multifibrata TaxID=1930274 RepID=A0A517ML10_9BACT|nr:carbon-nitrogen hydrolase family protein [Roseimaritima multifibrata]QDS95530.1 N-carbamoyl-D-amino acid hydrolase [Roseimaritima multifibrata]
MQLAAVQMDVTLAAIEKNRDRVTEWTTQAARNGADLIVFPECALTGYCFESREEANDSAMTVDDPRWKPLLECVANNKVHISLGFLEKTPEGSLFNASVLIGPDGMVGGYRKIHLPQLGVDQFVDRGDKEYAPLPAGDANVGLAICYDSSFPEPMRVLGLAGADIIALSTNWPVAAARTAEIVPPARSMENHLYFVAANRVGHERNFDFCGLSSICGPDGIELARAADDSEQILYATADLKLARSKRIERTVGAHVIDRFADRRPEFYKSIIEKKT